MTTGDRIASSSRQINRSLERGAGRRQTTTHHPRPGPIDRGPVWPPRRSFAHGHHSNAAPGRPARNRREAGTWKMLRPWPEVQHRPAGRVVGSRSLRMSCPARPRPVRHEWTRRHRISHGALVDSIKAAGKCGQQEQGGLQNPKGNRQQKVNDTRSPFCPLAARPRSVSEGVWY